MSQPILLTCIYAAVIAALQNALIAAMPNTGMGGMALPYIVLPLLALSVVGIYLFLRRSKKMRVAILIGATLVAGLVSISIYPQDSNLPMSEKFQKISQWIAGKQ